MVTVQGQKTGSEQSFISVIFQILLFLLVFLPSGSIFGLNVKIPAVILFIVLFGAHMFLGGHEFPANDLFFVLTVASVLMFFSMASLVAGYTATAQIFYQMIELGSTIFIAWLSIFLVRQETLSSERLIIIVTSAIVAVSTLKLFLLITPFISGLDTFGGIQSVFGENSYITGSIYSGLSRLQFTSDIVGPFALFALLCPSVTGVRLYKPLTSLFAAILLASGFIAFSRYIWFIYLVAIVAAAFIERSWKLLLAFVFVGIVFAAAFYSVVSSVLVTRFLSAGNDVSDQIRIQQAHALFRDFSNSPLWGTGMGSRARGVVRAEGHTYSYELQWLALLMEFGIVGILGFVSLIGISTVDLILCRHPAKIWLALLFTLWIAASFTNPYLTNSFAGATFAFFMAIFHRVRKHSLLHSRDLTGDFAESTAVFGS